MIERNIMEQDNKKINRSIKIYPLFASFTGDFNIFCANRHIIFNLSKGIKCESNNCNDNDCFNNMYSFSKTYIANYKKNRKC